MKNRYSQGVPFIGRDWMLVRFTPWRAKGSSSRCSAPASALRTVKTTEVRSWPLGAGEGPPITRKRVELSRRSSMFSAATARPSSSAASRLPTAATSASCAARAPAATVLATSIRSARGSCRSSQLRHWASGWAWDATRRTSSRRPLFESRQSAIGRTVSPQIVSSEATKVSRVWVTTPSVVFSTGTTPWSAWPRSTAEKTSPIVAWGSSSAWLPKVSRAARWEKVPSGPR